MTDPDPAGALVSSPRQQEDQDDQALARRVMTGDAIGNPPHPSVGDTSTGSTEKEALRAIDRDEWLRRYQQRLMEQAGLTQAEAADWAEAAPFEWQSESFENDPEGAADEELSYWEE